MEVLKLIIPSVKEFKTVWADVRAGWLKVSKSSDTNKSVVEVILGMTENTFRKRFPEAALTADNRELHEKFRNIQFRTSSLNPKGSSQKTSRKITFWEKELPLFYERRQGGVHA